MGGGLARPTSIHHKTRRSIPRSALEVLAALKRGHKPLQDARGGRSDGGGGPLSALSFLNAIKLFIHKVHGGVWRKTCVCVRVCVKC